MDKATLILNWDQKNYVMDLKPSSINLNVTREPVYQSTWGVRSDRFYMPKGPARVDISGYLNNSMEGVDFNTDRRTKHLEKNLKGTLTKQINAK